MGGRAHLARLAWLVSALACLGTGCASFPRVMAYERLPSAAMRGAWMEVAILAPADLRADEALPLVIFLHGGGDGPDSLDRSGIAGDLVRGWADGSVPRAVIVAPEGDLGFWANWYDGSRRYEDYVVDEVLPRVARRFHTAPCPEGCHVMGVSMGAEGSLRFALHRRGTWASVTAISGPSYDTARRLEFLRDPWINIVIPTWHVFGPPEPLSRVRADDPWVVWESDADVGARLHLAWGTQDRDFVREGSERFHAHLEARGVTHTAEAFVGGHNWVSWRPVIVAALRRMLGG
ncbi:MAG: alpha/beta hydrolase [Deltaproteobacteria bacterium]|jgi:enterochelin esterase-like enzyme